MGTAVRKTVPDAGQGPVPQNHAGIGDPFMLNRPPGTPENTPIHVKTYKLMYVVQPRCNRECTNAELSHLALHSDKTLKST